MGVGEEICWKKKGTETLKQGWDGSWEGDRWAMKASRVARRRMEMTGGSGGREVRLLLRAPAPHSI